MLSKTFLNDRDKAVEGVLKKHGSDANLRDKSKHFGNRIIQNKSLDIGKVLKKMYEIK